MESQIELTNRYLVPQTFNSLGSPPSTDAVIIIIDNDEDETLDPKNSKTDHNLDSPTFNSLGSLPSTDETLEPKKKKRRLGSWWDDVDAFNELSCVVKGLRKAKDVDDAESRVDLFFSSSTDLHETKKKDDERLLSSSHHHDNFIDLSEEDECIGETTSSSNKGNGHVSLEDLGVSVEDLKSLPWEAFDPTWEIRSETMDPWLGGYVKDMSDLLINSHA